MQRLNQTHRALIARAGGLVSACPVFASAADVPAMMAQHTLRTVKIDPRRVPGGSPVEETL
jgi:hypothetical protein